MFLRRWCPLLRISQRNTVHPQDFLKTSQICIKKQNFVLAHHRSFASQLPLLKCSSPFWRAFSTSADLQDSTNLTTEPEVFVQGNDVPGPIHDFSETNIEEYLLNELQRFKFEKPTTIQSHCIPGALSGRDIVGIGQTGSGKTLAYLLPALVHLRKHSPVKEGDGPRVLILAPTRELAQQISEVVGKFRHVCGIRSVCLFGGVSKGPQINYLRSGVNVCVATPGRLIDLLETGATNLHQVSYLVMDEADRMLDMGFEPQIRKILSFIKSQHQTLMWSATWPPEVQVLAKDFLNNVIHITVGSMELTANPNITQNIHLCNRIEKPEKLQELLQEILSERNNKVLLFAETKAQVDSLTRNLIWKNIPACSLHGDKTQLMRDKAIRDFRSRMTSVLIATDVAARGLDISDITHVINYDFPREMDTYVHRIGRTARLNRKGTAHSFFTPDNSKLARELVDVLQKCKQSVDPELLEMAESSGPQGRSSSRSYIREENDQHQTFSYQKSRPKNRMNYRRNSSFNRFGDSDRHNRYSSYLDQ